MKIIAEAPVRIDFARAWTDVLGDIREATLNAAIKKNVHGELPSGSHRWSEDGMRLHTRPTFRGAPVQEVLPR
jgi:hypothetical protein